jgi:soluble lytic murein transglycosylase
MLHLNRKSFTIALAGVSLFAMAAHSASTNDLFSRAAAQFRDKAYNDSFTLAQKSSESAQRTFLMGVSAFRSGKYETALPLLTEAEQKLPLLGDYAALYQAESLLKLKKYTEAAFKASSVAKKYPSSLLIRRADKLFVDVFIAAEDYKGALAVCQKFVDKYPSGADSVDVLFQTARSREETDDRSGAALIYRSIWLNNPASLQAKKSGERLKELEKAGIRVSAYTAEELLRRASTLYAANEFTLCLQTLQSIPLEGQPASVVARIDLRSGMAQFRLRNWKGAEKSLSRAAASSLPGVRSEARFWQAKSLDRQELDEQAFALFMGLVAEGRKQSFADDALLEAAAMRKSMGRYAEAARLYEQAGSSFPGSKLIPKAAWEGAWCRYLAGDNAVAAESFRALATDEAVREKALYWLGRTLENFASADAEKVFSILLDEYPVGFYATWYRENRGIKDLREQIGNRELLIDAPLPSGFEKPRLLAALGMLDEARSEMAAARKKVGDKKTLFPGLAKQYLEMGDYASAINLFMQNRPIKWDTASLPLWTAGYPMPYKTLVSKYAAANNLSEGLMHALMRAESSFSPTVKSPVGAVGLMQLMPATAKETSREKGKFDAGRLVIPEYNIKLGTKHFRDLMKVYDGDVTYSLAAYNAGAKAVARWRKNMQGLKKDEFIENIPYQETRDYVKKIHASAAIYRQLYGVK